VNDYRHLYKVYRSDPNLQAAHEAFAFIQLWDDHEFANDCHQEFNPDDNIPPNIADTPQPALRQAANQAWSEYGLADVTFDPNADWKNSIQVYRKLSLGTLADLIVVDERLYRDGPPCGNSQVFGRYFSVGCGEIEDSNRTMFGATQKQWFLDQVTRSTATWKLWPNEVMLMQLKIAGFIYVDLGSMERLRQRTRVFAKHHSERDVKNFVALTGICIRSWPVIHDPTSTIFFPRPWVSNSWSVPSVLPISRNPSNRPLICRVHRFLQISSEPRRTHSSL
jgi:alkaline phosphatase D